MSRLTWSIIWTKMYQCIYICTCTVQFGRIGYWLITLRERASYSRWRRVYSIVMSVLWRVPRSTLVVEVC